MTPRVGILTNIPSPYHVELCDAIARRGLIDLRVWYCAERDTRRSWGRQQPAHWHRVGRGWHIRTPRELLFMDPRPAIELVRWRPDLAVFIGYTMPAVQLAAWGACLTGLRWVYWGEAVGAGGDAWLRRAGRALALWPARRWASGFFGVGQKGVENFRRMLGADRPVLKVPYFSDLARFAPSNGAGDSRGLTFLYVGSFIHRKGVDVLARAFNDVVQARPEARLVVAGDGDASASFDRHLSPAAATRVARRGFVPWTRLPELYAQGDFLVMPSRYDGWGLVIPEAMASGLPVIGSVAAGATLDLVRDGVTGWRVEPDDPRGLAATMLRAAALSPAERATMRRQCLVRARRFDAEVGARVFERAIKTVLRT